jgi:hypothetical protein
MIASSGYKLVATRRGAPDRPYGWEIVRRDDGIEVERSAGAFRSRREAMADGLPAAIAWENGNRS